MRKTGAFVSCMAAFLLAGVSGCSSTNAVSKSEVKSMKSEPQWQVGTQCWTFRLFTFAEAVQKASSLGVDYVEIFPGQKLMPGSEAKVHHTATPGEREQIKALAREAGLDIGAYGVVNGKDEAEWRQIFEFAKALDIEIVTSEPPPEALEMVDKLAQEFGITLAIHNHPAPSFYYQPEKVVAALEGRSNHMGFCADIGHWTRSGLDPVDSLKMAEGRLKSFHFKDISAPNEEAHDVPWGSGAAEVYAILVEAKRQNFDGKFSVEYENNWENNLPQIRQSLDYFDLVQQSLDESGYKPLFDGQLENAQLEPDGWTYEGGVLSATGHGDIWTKDRYGNFILEAEFKTQDDTNSGVFLRTADINEWLHTAIEVQISQPVEKNNRHNTGAIFDVAAPTRNMMKPAGEWNKYVIIAKDNMIHVILNGRQVNYVNLDEWPEAGKNPDGTPNKFKYAYKDMSREGHIGFQFHGNPVWYRNIRIKPL